jgi:hypothetical protein
MKRLALVAFAATLIAGACGDDDITTSIGPPETTATTARTIYPAPNGASDIVLQLAVRANQPDPLDVLEAFPEFTLFGDGTLLVADPETRSDPIPGLLEYRVDSDGIQQLLGLADDAGALVPPESFGSTDLADGDTTAFVVDIGSLRSEFGVYDIGGTGMDLTPEQTEARAALTGLRDALRDFATVLGDHVSGGEPFPLSTVAVFGVPRGSGAVAVLPFDLEVRGEEVDPGVVPVHCFIATGDDLDALLGAVAAVERNARWLVGGDSWAVVFRPLLPGDGDCTELAGG